MALVIAVYSLAPPVARMRVSLVSVVQIPIALLTLILVLYFLFFRVFGQPCPSFFYALCDWIVITSGSTITPSDIAFFVLFVWMAIACTVHMFIPRRIASFSVVKMVELVDRLEYEKKYSELLEFVEPYLPLIGKAANRRLPLQKFHDKLELMQGGMKAIIHGIWNKEEGKRESQRSRFTKKTRRWIGMLAVVFPKNEKAKTAADNIISVLFQSEPLRVYIAKNRPYFAIPLIQQEMFGGRQFFEAYLELLIADTGSVLYQEIQLSQNSSNQHGYEYPGSNRLLNFLLADAKKAQQLEIWRPVGEHILQLLNPIKSPDFDNHLKSSGDDFDKECWEDGVFVGIRFFDLMVTAAAYQGVTWHMWLYYMTNVIESLEESYDTSDPSVNPSDEFPTRSARLVYEVIHALSDWVGLVSQIPEDSPHRRSLILVESLEREWDSWYLDNENIPMSAAMALGTCTMTLLMSERIGINFSGYMYEVILTAINSLRRDDFEGHIRKFLILSIIHGGHGRQYGHDPDYGRKLMTLLSKVDHVIVSDVDDYVHELKKAYPYDHSDL